MYIFAEPVTEDQVAEIQSQNDAKIEHFERNILGLNRGEEIEAQEDDGKWANIRASVQEAMDKDELSIDNSGQHEEARLFDSELESSTKHQRVLEEGPLYANKNRTMSDENSAEVGCDDDVGGVDEKRNSDNIEAIELVDQRQQEDDELKVEDTKGSEDEREVEEDNETANVEQEAGIGAFKEDSAVLEDQADKNLESQESASETRTPRKDLPCYDNDGLVDAESSPASKVNEKATRIPSEKPNVQTSSTQSDKSAYTPPVPDEEPSDPDYQTEADRPFLDAMDEEEKQSTSDLSSSSEILAMTLTLRNKVNNQFVHRPENLTANDVWSIEYSLLEVPTQQKARSLYAACMTRRKKELDTPEVPEDAEVINRYLANLRNLSKKGKEWREKIDERDSQKPIQVLSELD